MSEIKEQAYAQKTSETARTPFLSKPIAEELAMDIPDKKYREKMASTYQAIVQYVNEASKIPQNNSAHLFYQWGAEAVTNHDLSSKSLSLSKEKAVDFMNGWEYFIESKKVQEVFDKDSLEIAERMFGIEIKQMVLAGEREIIDCLPRLKNRPRIITPIVKDKKVSEFAAESFFMSVFGLDTSHKTPHGFYKPFVLELLVEYVSSSSNKNLRELLERYEGEIIDFITDQEKEPPYLIDNLSKIFGQKKEAVQKALNLAKSQKPSNKLLERGAFGDIDRSTKGALSLLVKLSENEDMSSMLSDLAQLGRKIGAGGYAYGVQHYQDYTSILNNILEQRKALIPFMQQLYEHANNPHLFSHINVDVLRIIQSFVGAKDKLFADIDDVRKYRPGFEYGLHTDRSSPYDQVVYGNHSGNSPISYEELIRIKKDKGNIPSAFLNPLFDRMISFCLGKNIKKEDIIPFFEKGINTILDHIEENVNFEWFYHNQSFLMAFAVGLGKNEVLADFPDKFPRLMRLMEEGGPLHLNRDFVVQDIFGSTNFDKRAKELEQAFTKKQPYWKSLYLLSMEKFEKELTQANVNAPMRYPIHSVTDVPMKALVKRYGHRVTNDSEIIGDLNSGKIDSVPFEKLTKLGKKMVLRDYLRRVVETSRSEKAKTIAEKRNRDFSSNPLVLSDGDYIHGASVSALPEFFLNGNLCGETLAETKWTDSYPFHTDFSRVADAGKYRSVSDVLQDSRSWGYGVDTRNNHYNRQG